MTRRRALNAPLIFRSIAPDPTLGTTGLTDEYVILDDETPWEQRIVRHAPLNHAAVLEALERGALECISPLPALASFLAFHRRPARRGRRATARVRRSPT